MARKNDIQDADLSLDALLEKITNATLPDVIAVRDKLNEHIIAQKASAAQAFRNEMEQRAQAAGLNLAEIMPPANMTLSKGPAKFRNPDNPNESWTGRGKKPKWLTHLIQSGKTIEELRIQQ